MLAAIATIRGTTYRITIDIECGANGAPVRLEHRPPGDGPWKFLGAGRWVVNPSNPGTYSGSYLGVDIDIVGKLEFALRHTLDSTTTVRE